jgi:ligand-binding SRPBCC domain-containing protein
LIRIEEKTVFNLPIEAVFDAERNISLHSATQGHRGERAVAGVISGLIEKGQEVEWEAVHFGIKQRLRVRITHMEKPDLFRDEMVFGAFKSMSHEHRFRSLGEGRTEKTDTMLIEAPWGLVGRIAEAFFLGAYMRRFLRKKNADLKAILERPGA